MKTRVLVVDDEESILRMLRELLTDKGGYETVAANTAAEMFQKLNEQVFDLVLLDVILGDVNGLDLLPLIKNTHPDLPVVILSALGFDEDFIEEARRMGASGFLKKTLAPDQLLTEVTRALAGH
ncbi:MAG: response regulator [Limisphaerales bacterium]